MLCLDLGTWPGAKTSVPCLARWDFQRSLTDSPVWPKALTKQALHAKSNLASQEDWP